LDGGVEAGDDVLGVAEESLDGGGAFDAFEVVAVFAGVAVASRSRRRSSTKSAAIS
jgi:hypothetical protein